MELRDLRYGLDSEAFVEPLLDEFQDRQGICPVSETLARRIARPALVLRPLDPPVRIPLPLAWRDAATGPLRALERDALERNAI